MTESTVTDVAHNQEQDKPDPPQRWVWRDMDPEDRVERLGELALWVDWLSDTFDLRNQIARCWYRHTRITEQLTALYLGWVRTYVGDPTKLGLRAEAEWIKDLYAFLPRLSSAGCQSSHMETPGAQLTDHKALEEWIDEDPEFLTSPRFHPAKAQAVRIALEAQAAAEARAARKESGQKKGA